MRITPAGALLALMVASCTSSTSTTPTNSDRAACQAAAGLLDQHTTTSPAQGQHIVTTALAAHNPRIRQAGHDLQRNADANDQPGVNRSVVQLLDACRNLGLGPH